MVAQRLHSRPPVNCIASGTAPFEGRGRPRRKISLRAEHAEPNAVDVPAGKTVRLVYTFNQPGMLEYDCHVLGHYLAGMRGTLTVTPA